MTESRHFIEMYLTDRAKADDRDYSHFHPSEIGGCPRATWFKTIGIPSNDDLTPATLMKFDTGHSVHARVQGYFRAISRFGDKVGTATDIVVSAEKGDSTVGFKVNDDGERIPSKKMIVKGESGRVYPYSLREKVWIKQGLNDLEKEVLDLVPGDEFFLEEVPFENPECHLSGHVDGLIYEGGEPCILEIKSINAKGFTRLFFTDELKFDYAADNIRDDRKCHVCGKSTRTGETMATHMMECHYELAIPHKKHVIQGNAYMDALGAKKTLFYYENKDNQEVCDIIEYRNDKLISDLHEMCVKLWNMLESTWGGTTSIPKKPAWASPECFSCKYCGYSHICWKQTEGIYEAVEQMLLNEIDYELE